MTLAACYRQELPGAIGSRSVALELDPPQPKAVATALEQLLGVDAAEVADPWWAAGLAEALGGGDGPAAQDPRSGAGVVEP